MLQAIFRVFMLVAPGYFANDIVEGVGKITGVKTNESGKPAWWFPVVVLLAVAAVIYFVVNPFKSKR